MHCGALRFASTPYYIMQPDKQAPMQHPKLDTMRAADAPHDASAQRPLARDSSLSSAIPHHSLNLLRPANHLAQSHAAHSVYPPQSVPIALARPIRSAPHPPTSGPLGLQPQPRTPTTAHKRVLTIDVHKTPAPRPQSHWLPHSAQSIRAPPSGPQPPHPAERSQHQPARPPPPHHQQ